MNPKEISTDIVALEQQNLTVKQVEEFYGDGLPYDYNRLVEVGRVAARNVYQSMLDLGKACMRIAAHETKGKYEEALERMGTSHSDGWFARQAVLKIGDIDESSPVNFLGKRKVRSVLQLDKPTIKTYLEGGDLGTIPHDDVEKMSSRELEEEVRKLRTERKKQEEEHAKQLEAVEEVVRKKESKISELEMEVAGKQPPTKEELAEQELKDVRKQMIIRFSEMNTTLDELNALLDKAQTLDGVTVDLLQSLSDGVAEFYSLFDDKYQDFNQDMENIRPLKKEA